MMWRAVAGAPSPRRHGGDRGGGRAAADRDAVAQAARRRGGGARGRSRRSTTCSSTASGTSARRCRCTSSRRSSSRPRAIPTIKGKIRQLRQARMRKRMMAAVPKASVVITNPTHYAVALQYERGMNAPVCVAKGVDCDRAQDPRGRGRARHPDRGEPAARPRAARHRRDRPGDSRPSTTRRWPR